MSRCRHLMRTHLHVLVSSSSMMRRLLGTMAAAASPGPSTNRSAPVGDGGNGDRNFVTNILIILAVLLCGLISMLGVNLIVQCARRYNWRLPFETTAARLAVTGLKKSTLRRIPVVIYGSSVSIPATECPICLVHFADGENIRVLPSCNHGFHVRCIDTWLSSHSSCPTCRHSLLDMSVAAVCIAVGEWPPVVDGNPLVAAEVDEVS